MNERVYILLDIVHGKAEQVVYVLRESPGVAMADAVEGSPHVVVVIEAVERQRLAKLTIQALASVETMTENVCLLPAKHGLNSKMFARLPSPNRSSSQRGGSKRLCQCTTVN